MNAARGWTVGEFFQVPRSYGSFLENWLMTSRVHSIVVHNVLLCFVESGRELSGESSTNTYSYL